MLYIVSTPIGNLKDISLRALEVLKSVDIIACEDTRRSAVLLNHYGISKPLISFHKFNERTAAENLITKLKDGKNIALISDAGTPLISDPGNILTEELRKNGIKYTVIPGACALVAGLALSGFDSAKFLFLGFLTGNNKNKTEFLEKYKNIDATLIFYISPHDLQKDAGLIHSVLGARRACLVREITKIYESVFDFVLGSELPELKGEMVLVVEGAKEIINPLNSLSVEKHCEYYMNLGFSKTDAIKKTAKDRNVTKNEIYKVMIKNLLDRGVDA